MKNNMYIISDTHFFHDRMVEFCGRPENHTHLIGNNMLRLNKSLKPDDVLIHLGDICIGRDAEAHELYIEPLRCKKWLVRGNHDNKPNGWYLSHGWDFVCEEFLLDMFGLKMVFTHIPMSRIPARYDYNVHGHLHNTGHHEAKLTHKHVLIACENMGYKPQLLRRFVGL